MASGGMGAVYRAVDLTTQQRVALKLMHRLQDVARFQREAELLACIDDPAVVRYVAHGLDGEDAYLAMRWLDGEDLDARLGQGPLGVADTLVLAERVCEALTAVHAAGVVHRDIKPHNIMLEAGQVERAVLVDFGVARAEQRTRLTATGAMVGTIGYSAPEQLHGMRVEPRTDLFALGCVLYECLSGLPAFRGPTPMAVLGAVLQDEPACLEDLCEGLPEGLADLVHQLLHKEAEARPPSAVSVLAQVRRIASGVATDQSGGRATTPAGLSRAAHRDDVTGRR